MKNKYGDALPEFFSLYSKNKLIGEQESIQNDQTIIVKKLCCTGNIKIVYEVDVSEIIAKEPMWTHTYLFPIEPN